MKGMAKFWEQESHEKAHKDIKKVLEKKAGIEKGKKNIKKGKKDKKGDCPTCGK